MSTSFFKNIAVTYWTAQIYNDTTGDIRCEIDEEFTSPLVDAASNYVCSVERMELSGNNIFFYNANSDSTNVINPRISTFKKCCVLYFLDSSLQINSSVFEMYIYGSYSSLGSLIDSMNYWKRVPDDNGHTMEWMNFSLTTDGKIRMVIQNPYTSIADEDEQFPQDSEVTYRFGDADTGLVLMFSSPTMASIFGLPRTFTGDDYDPELWFNTFSDVTWFDDLAFQTKSSRVDCGVIPTMIQLRSTLPFESDQVSSTKTNIVTDFNIVANSASSFNLTNFGNTKRADAVPMSVDKLEGEGVSLGMGSMIIYTPAERRWLNFSAPIPIYQIRLWVELVFNDPDQVNVYFIPPGGKFSIKLGLYLREN